MPDGKLVLLFYYVPGENTAVVMTVMEGALQAKRRQVLTAVPLTTATMTTKDPQRKTLQPDQRGMNPLQEGASEMSIPMVIATRNREEKGKQFLIVESEAAVMGNMFQGLDPEVLSCRSVCVQHFILLQ